MDPDMVRQQEEAEREALAALAKKKSQAAPPIVPQVEAEAHPAAPVEVAMIQPIFAATSATPVKHSLVVQLFSGIGRFLSFGAAGAILGIGAGNAFMTLWDLPAEQAQSVILGTVGGMALICSLLSLRRSA